jgi:acetylornithine/succinyldiaminopimelate/putrescine aminotransferase
MALRRTLLCSAKPCPAAFSVGFLSNNAVLGTLKPGQHGSTIGGNPLACAVARAALRVLVDEGMIENAAPQGVRFLDGLRSMRAKTIREVRGRGLMLALELHPDAGGARRYCEALQSRGILAKDTHDHMIRIAPPLVITSDQVDWALDRFKATLRRDDRAKLENRLFVSTNNGEAGLPRRLMASSSSRVPRDDARMELCSAGLAFSR